MNGWVKVVEEHVVAEVAPDYCILPLYEILLKYGL